MREIPTTKISKTESKPQNSVNKPVRHGQKGHKGIGILLSSGSFRH
jgi:hypothetical protein